VGLLLHFVLSVLLAAIFALIATRLGMGGALAAGAGFGLVVYLVDFYAWTAVFSWFSNARNWITIVSHIVFGLVLAWAYKTFEARVRPRAR
jgi:uncharacterized membrane protein YagU involved in acid resistance